MGGGVHDGVMVRGALPAMSGEPMVRRSSSRLVAVTF